MIQIAKHPKTGKEIRVLRSEGCVWRNLKTLVWLKGDDCVTPNVLWNRYDVGTSTVEDWHAVTAKGVEVDICILLGDERRAKEWIMAKHYRTVRMFAVTKSLLTMIGYDEIAALKIPNMLCLENCIEIYPIVESQWDSTEADARTMISLVLQYKRTFPIVKETAHYGVASTHGLLVESEIVAPPLCYLITQFYTTPKPRRSNEIVETLKRNVACPYLDRIVLLNEKIFDIPVESDKIEQHVIGDRLNFKYVFQHILESIPRNSLVVIANSDIFLDDSWRILWSLSMKDTFLSLLRWDESEEAGKPPVLFGPREDSQDTWVVDSNSVKDRSWDWTAMDIRFGQNGCDNVVNIEMLKQKFSLANPCMSLVTHHLHHSGYRTYEMTDIIYRPAIMYLSPTGIHDLKPEFVLSGAPVETLREAGFRLRAQSETFQTMLAKKHPEFKDGIVTVGEREIPLHTYENVKQTKDGLAHTYNSILIGKSEIVSDLWADTEMSVLAPCVDVDVALIAFCPDRVADDPWLYMAQYLGKILYLRGRFGRGEFLGNDTDTIKAALQQFSWSRTEVPVLSRETGFQAWCRKAHVWYPQGGLKDLITRLEVATLRTNMLVPWKNTANKRLVFLVDSAWITAAFIVAVQTALGSEFQCLAILPTTPIAEAMSLIHGALGVISFTGNNALYGSWLLSAKSFVFEIQVESEPSIDIQQLCSVSNVLHHLQTVPRGMPHVIKDVSTLIATVVKYVQPAGTTPLKASNTIVMPTKSTTGFFAHNGDSFREMVQIWNERGYICLREVEGVQQVWLGDVGEVLLYDRPTMEWAHASKETSWKRALFGNPAVRGQPNASSWSFWPRRPRLVEELTKDPRKSFEERTNSVVFYGRSENGIQLRNRTTAKWEVACSEFVHLTGATAKYPYTQEEYLLRLANARYGLCLAGYGKKCHREIECMAMGCVPIVAAEVDMDSYAVAPIEGVHYLRVSKPAEVAEKIAGISAADWEKMSAACYNWWLLNASATGLWELTKILAYSASESG